MHFQESGDDSSGKIGRRAWIEKYRRRKSAGFGSARQFHRQRRRRDCDRSAAIDRADSGNGAEAARDRLGNRSANRGGGSMSALLVCHSERSGVEEPLTISSSSSAEGSEILRLRRASLRMT